MNKLKQYLKTGDFPVVHTRTKTNDIRFSESERKKSNPIFCTLCDRDILWWENFTFHIGNADMVVVPPDVLGFICPDCQKEIESHGKKEYVIENLEIPK